MTQIIGIHHRESIEHFGTILWRNRDRFVNVSGEGYYLKRRMKPEEADRQMRLSEMLSEDDDVAGGTENE